MSALFGTLVGIERQWRHKNAGLKTNALVSIGATSFGLIALEGFGFGSQPTQIAAGVVTGVGFIGAGVIMHRGASLQGINTAATLWAAAGMGLALGQGFYQLAIYILVIVLITQFSLQWAANYINKRSGLRVPLITYRLSVGFDPASTEQARKAWSKLVAEFRASVTSYREVRGETESTFEALFELAEVPLDGASALGKQLSEIPRLTHIECAEYLQRENNN